MKKLIEYIKEYGVSVFVWKGLSNCFPSEKLDNVLSKWILKHKHQAVLRYLAKRYSAASNETPTTAVTPNPYPDCIWTAWLQGEENAPEVIRMTLASMRKNAGNHRVIVLTTDNIADYIDLPQAICEQYKQNKMLSAHYADIVRMMVLAKYGGLWLDATTLVIKPIDEAIFSSDFFSLKHDRPNSVYISKGRWIVRVMAGRQASPCLCKISKCLNWYWTNHITCIDYFVFDYLIAMLYKQDSYIRMCIDQIPLSNPNLYSLRAEINEPYSPQRLQQISNDTILFCLPYRNHYQSKTTDGQLTVYGYLREYYLDHTESASL